MLSRPPTWLRARAKDRLAAAGLAPATASEVARVLVATSARGVSTHGVELLPTYLAELASGRANPRPTFHVERYAACTRLLDADHALGIHAALEAVSLAESTAGEHGAGVVHVTKSNHFGAAGSFALELASLGLVGIVMSNADALLRVPGADRAILGTNPLSIAIPTAGRPFCLDMATSQVAWSRIIRGEVEPGWAFDDAGQDCAEEDAGPPSAAAPLGGYKGAGLALAIELLCAGLVGTPWDRELEPLYVPGTTHRPTAHLVIALRLKRADLGGPLRRTEHLAALESLGATIPGWPESRLSESVLEIEISNELDLLLAESGLESEPTEL